MPAYPSTRKAPPVPRCTRFPLATVIAAAGSTRRRTGSATILNDDGRTVEPGHVRCAR